MATKTNTTSNLATIKAAIVYAHDEMNNTRALGKKDFEKLGLPEQELTLWSSYVEDLRKAVVEYNKLTQDPDKEPSEKEEKTAAGKITAIWRLVLKQGTEDAFHKGFFLRRGDDTTIAKTCGLYFQSTARGRVAATRNATDFRKMIETLIGIRLAGNAMLDDATRDLIVGYESAEHTIKSRTKMLDGDNKTKGLRDTVKGQKAELAIQQDSLKQLGVEEEKIDAFTKALKKAIEDNEKAIKEAEKAKSDAQKVIDENKDAYDKAIALLKSIGDYQNK